MFQLFIQFKTSSSPIHLFILFHYCIECGTHTYADAVRFFLLSFCVHQVLLSAKIEFVVQIALYDPHDSQFRWLVAWWQTMR